MKSGAGRVKWYLFEITLRCFWDGAIWKRCHVTWSIFMVYLLPEWTLCHHCTEQFHKMFIHWWYAGCSVKITFWSYIDLWKARGLWVSYQGINILLTSYSTANVERPHVALAAMDRGMVHTGMPIGVKDRAYGQAISAKFSRRGSRKTQQFIQTRREM